MGLFATRLADICVRLLCSGLGHLPGEVQFLPLRELVVARDVHADVPALHILRAPCVETTPAQSRVETDRETRFPPADLDQPVRLVEW